ncbi:MAG: metallophosphoesterase [Planctomycetota bacterium]
MNAAGGDRRGLARSGRRIFVGDIQGCREPLARLLAAVAFDPAVDTLFPVGDLVNKGPDSEGTLRLLRDVDARPVLGNHDLYWLSAGRVRDRESAAWLRAQPIVRDLGDILLVHAGVHPHWRVETLAHRVLTDADIEFATNVRYCTQEGERPAEDWPPPGPPFRPWDEFYRGDKRIVFGHWARRGLVRTPRVVGLDSGCVYGMQLSAWIAEEDRVVQVSAAP